VYALGVTAFHAVTGRRPFEGYDGAALLAQQVHTDPVPVGSLATLLQPRFAQVIDRAIRREPAARWESVEAMAQELSAARAVAVRSPAALRQFARHAVEHSDRLGLILGVGAAATVSGLAVNLAFTSFFGFEVVPFLILGSVTIGVALLQLASHLLEIRRIAATGYNRGAALRALDELEADEATTRRPHTGRWTERPRTVLLAGALTMLAGIYGAATFSNYLVLVSLLLATVAPVIALNRVFTLRGTGRSWWSRLLRSKVGARLWRAATLGLGTVRTTPTSGEPTALALGGVVGELFARLSEPQRRSLAAVPDLVERLEAMALDRAAPRSVEAVMALETLRLDLLRLHAGEIAADSITQGLEQLQQVGRQVDAVLELRVDDG
jgi:hypothetical protein